MCMENQKRMSPLVIAKIHKRVSNLKYFSFYFGY